MGSRRVYVGTGLLAAYHCPERDSALVQAYLASGIDIAISRLTEPELSSSLSRKAGTGELTSASREAHLRKRARLAPDLLTRLIEMIEIQVGITACPDELPRSQVSLLGEHELQGDGADVVEGFSGQPVRNLFRYGAIRSTYRLRFPEDPRSCQDRTGAGDASRTTASGLGLAERVTVGLISNNAEGAPLVA